LKRRAEEKAARRFSLLGERKMETGKGKMENGIFWCAMVGGKSRFCWPVR
jgi:hypothetical protein